jgi:hypothetical protein
MAPKSTYHHHDIDHVDYDHVDYDHVDYYHHDYDAQYDHDAAHAAVKPVQRQLRVRELECVVSFEYQRRQLGRYRDGGIERLLWLTGHDLKQKLHVCGRPITRGGDYVQRELHV